MWGPLPPRPRNSNYRYLGKKMVRGIDNGHLIIPQDKVPVAAYQALYHKLTSKTEKLRETFNDAYLIRAQDIMQLDAMLCQTVKQFPVQGKIPSSTFLCGMVKTYIFLRCKNFL